MSALRFITLTSGDGRPIVFNVANIVTVQSDMKGEGTWITTKLDDESFWSVKEPFGEVCERLRVVECGA